MITITDEGINVTVNKTQHEQIIEWSDELKCCVDKIKKLQHKIHGLHLFCNQKGQPYTTSGFDSIWQRAMIKALKAGLITEKFRFHDIRRKAATDAEKKAGREFARQLLGHEKQSTTAIYISGRRSVKPLK